jgi:signal transduction histidine kinase
MSFWAKVLSQVPLLRKQQVKFFKRYLLPIVAVVLALQFNWLIAPHLSFLPPFLAFLAAIMITAWYGGFPSAVFAVVLSDFIINYYFIPPLYDFSLKLGDLGTMGFFAAEAIIMAYCIDYLRKNENKLRRANLDLEHQMVSKHQELSDKEANLRGIMTQLAVTEERERRQLAVELHDYLAQLLTLARMKNKQAQQFVYRSAGESNRYLTETDELLRKSVDYVRTLMAELYPTQLHELGLPAALRWLAGQMPRHGLAIELFINSESLPLTSDKALLLYHSVRELLMNIVKHAAVNRAFVILEVESDAVSITVQDHGRGFDPSTLLPTIPGHHFGLQSVRERITAIGGIFEIKSAVGKGASVTLTVPLQAWSESEELRAASSFPQDRVRAKPAGSENQQSLPL